MIEYGKDIAYLFVSLVAFILGNKTKKIDNLSKYQSMYDTFVTQYEKQYQLLDKKVVGLQNDVDNLNLRNAIILEESQSWKQKFERLQKLYDALKSEFEKYKINHK
jgi:hypothetical protein